MELVGQFFYRGVRLSRFRSILNETLYASLRLEEMYTWLRLEGRLHRGRQGSANDISLMKGIAQSSARRKLQTRRVGGRDIKKLPSTLSLHLLTPGKEYLWRDGNWTINLLVSRLSRRRYWARYQILIVCKRILTRSVLSESYIETRTFHRIEPNIICNETKKYIKAGTSSFRKIYK